MENWLILAAAIAVVVLIGVWTASRMRQTPAAQPERYGGSVSGQAGGGPTDDDWERADAPADREATRRAGSPPLNDPAQFGMVTPGAVTPAASGSPEEFYEASGVGRSGPRHLSGPPSDVQQRSADRGEGRLPSHPTDDGWTAEPTDETSWMRGRSLVVAMLAGIGAAVGVGVTAYLRRRARRKNRLARLRERTAEVGAVLSGTALTVGGRAAAIATDAGAQVASVAGGAGSRAAELAAGMDTRARAGGGALSSALVLYVLFKALRRERTRREQAEQAAAEAAAAMAGAGNRLVRLKSSAMDLAQHATLPPLPGSPIVWGLGGAASVLAGGVVLLARRRGRKYGEYWDEMVVSESAPARSGDRGSRPRPRRVPRDAAARPPGGGPTSIGE